MEGVELIGSEGPVQCSVTGIDEPETTTTPEGIEALYGLVSFYSPTGRPRINRSELTNLVGALWLATSLKMGCIEHLKLLVRLGPVTAQDEVS